jgi:hypothetical protein
MPVIAYTYPGTTTRTRWVFEGYFGVEAIAKTLREIGMCHVVIEEDA